MPKKCACLSVNDYMIFNYQARTKEGETQAGRVEAASKKAAAEILQRQDLIVIFIEEARKAPIYARRLKFFEKVKKKELVIFSRQITTLFEAEVPLVSALQTVAHQTQSASFREKIFEISTDIEGGSSLSDAFGKHTDIFSDFYTNMVKAGEASGKLDTIFAYLANHIEREYMVASRIKGALIYPAFVVAGFFIAGALLMIFVIPQLTGILADSGTELPTTTKIIIGVSNFMRSFWYILLLGIVGGAVLFFRYIKTKNGKNFWDRVQLKLPVFGPILVKVYIFRFTESLGTLIDGGLPIIRAIEIARDVVGNNVYKEVLNDVREAVRRGGTIGGTLSLYKEIPAFVTQMIVVGEQAGKLEGVLKHIANFYQKEVENVTDNITSLIEPILITVMGIAVGILVAGVMIPIYNMVGSFQ